MKLFRVHTRMPGSYKTSYVVADNPTDAYAQVRAFLNKEGVGVSNSDRSLMSVELLAEEGKYPECEVRLFLDASVKNSGGTSASPMFILGNEGGIFTFI